MPNTQTSKRSSTTSGDARAPIRVLVVEDDADTRESLEAMLASEGFTVRVAEDGLVALGVLDGWIPDVLIIDIHLPGMDGYELMRTVRARDELRAARAIALTGIATVSDRITALAAGFTTHLTKPAEPQALISTVASLGSGANRGG